jgi:hypothetical protein
MSPSSGLNYNSEDRDIVLLRNVVYLRAHTASQSRTTTTTTTTTSSPTRETYISRQQATLNVYHERCPVLQVHFYLPISVCNK